MKRPKAIHVSPLTGRVMMSVVLEDGEQEEVIHLVLSIEESRELQEAHRQASTTAEMRRIESRRQYNTRKTNVG